MSDDHPLVAQRRRLLSVISETFQDDREWEGRVVCGFALVVELAGPDGERGLASRSSDATGDTDLTPWAANGLLNFALAEEMFDGEVVVSEEDEDEDEDR